jgi:hypothetical protein
MLPAETPVFVVPENVAELHGEFEHDPDNCQSNPPMSTPLVPDPVPASMIVVDEPRVLKSDPEVVPLAIV